MQQGTNRTAMMAKHGGKGRHGRVEASRTPTSLGGVFSSNLRRSLSSTPSIFPQRRWRVAAATTLLLVLGAAAAAAASSAQVVEGFGDSAVAEPVLALNEAEYPAGSVGFQQGARHAELDGGDGRRLQASSDSIKNCIDSPLWQKEVDPANYKFGCKEIEEMLHGNTTLVGNGQVRDVYVVEYGGETVVLRVLREQQDRKKRHVSLRMHRTEAIALDAVRGHPNIAGMLGICGTTVVSGFYPTPLTGVMWAPRPEPLPAAKVVSMALDAARGLQAIHEASIAPIVQFDMKPHQLLVAEDGRVMLNDFNAAQFMGTRPSGAPCPMQRSAAQVTLWQAPEHIAGKLLTEKTDVYSLGMIFFSLMSGKIPFPRTDLGKQMILSGERPAIDPSWHTGYMQVVQGMWQAEPADRPSARQVAARLEEILVSLSAYA